MPLFTDISIVSGEPWVILDGMSEPIQLLIGAGIACSVLISFSGKLSSMSIAIFRVQVTLVRDSLLLF